MDEIYFNSIENETYYFPNIRKGRIRYITDKKNFDKIVNMLDTLENDFIREKNDNKSRLS